MDNQNNQQPPKRPGGKNPTSRPSEPEDSSSSQNPAFHIPEGFQSFQVPMPPRRQFVPPLGDSAPPQKPAYVPTPIQRPPKLPRPILGKRYEDPTVELRKLFENLSIPSPHNCAFLDPDLSETTSNFSWSFVLESTENQNFAPVVTSTPIPQQEEYIPPVLTPDINFIFQSWKEESDGYLSTLDYLQDKVKELFSSMQNLRQELSSLIAANLQQENQLNDIDNHFQQIVQARDEFARDLMDYAQGSSSAEEEKN